MRRHSLGFTLIELLVVVAIIGIISAIGVVAYSGYKASAEKKKAELTLNSIYLAEEEYKSNNGSYYQSSSATQIATELFDGKNEDEFKNQNYQFSIKVSGDTFQIKAKHKTGSCTLTLNEKNKLTPSGC
jgi:type IV pilus assembly protein PilE|tara:strand:- start:65 stop:451 length:387 start_codon:yes stop_codon:yes gene_type:complete